jgi:predicted nucleic acid-binding Zn ribbon protein
VTRGAGPARIGPVLQAVLDEHGVSKQIERHGVLELWPEIVGPKLAEVTRVKGLDEAALFVEVRSSAWLMELSMMKEAFLERVNERLQDAPIERIVFVLAETT